MNLPFIYLKSCSPLSHRPCAVDANNAIPIPVNWLSFTDFLVLYDIDALFSAAFALVLADIIRPANEILWDLPQFMHLLDEYVSQRVTPAQAYGSDLLQILELHKKLRSVDNTLQIHGNVDDKHESVTETDGLTISCPVPVGISPDPV